MMNIRLAGLILIACLASTGPATAQAAAEFYEQGVTARREQRFEDAVASLERAAALEPRNADVQVQLGFAHLALGNSVAAQAVFARVLEIAPGYHDARFGMAQIAFRNGELEKARELAQVVLEAQPDNAEAAVLLTSIERAEAAQGEETTRTTARAPRKSEAPAPASRLHERPAAPSPKKWRLDIGSEVSDLSGGRPSWTDSAIALSYRLAPRTTVAGRARLAIRSGRRDVQLEARLDQALTPSLSLYGLIAATPDADFLAKFSIGGGASWRPVERSSAWGPLVPSIDVRHDVYSGSEVTTITAGLQYLFLDERLGIAARWVHSWDNAGTSADGYVLRGDIVATERLRLFAGYADAPEISEGVLVETRTIFTGMSVDLSENATVNASYAHEDRAAFDRNTFGLGLSIRF